jgi:hypothetical protein
MHTDNRVLLIHRAREHARQFNPSNALGKLLSLLVNVSDHALIVLGSAQLQVFDSVADIGRQLFDHLHFFLGAAPFPHQRLGTVLVVPETGLTGELVELRNVAF